MRQRPVPPLVLLLVAFLPGILFGQRSFETGYMVDRNGNREVVEIRNDHWRFNPEAIHIRRAADQAEISVPTAALDEFGIPGKARFVNRLVAIEKSVSSRRDPLPARPVQEVERVLLRVEVEGAAELYSYRTPRVSKYFLAENQGRPIQLIYTFSRRADGHVTENRTYVRQLARLTGCPSAAGEPAAPRYELAAIREVVRAHNACIAGTDQIVYDNPGPARLSPRITPFAGITGTGLRLRDRQAGDPLPDAAHRTALRGGVELEYALPRAAGAWAVLLRPGYYGFRASAAAGESAFELTYRAVELPFSVRYAYRLRPHLQLFAGGGAGLVVPFGRLRHNGEEVASLQGTVTYGSDLGLRYHDRWNLSVGYEAQGNSLVAGSLRNRTSGIRITTGYTLP